MRFHYYNCKVSYCFHVMHYYKYINWPFLIKYIKGYSVNHDQVVRNYKS